MFVNRFLETNPVPVLWTTNAIGNIDLAILRRMSFVLKLDLPSRAAAARMLARIAAEEGVDSDAGFDRLLDAAPETATVLRVVTRSARLAGEADGELQSAEALVRGGVLLFDEVDSLLSDRTTATTDWETGQVNETLTWLDHHPLPVIAATDHRHRLDPAALRRFVFKLDLQPLGGSGRQGPTRASSAFRHPSSWPNCEA